jgi:hypothetical protein
VIDSTQNKLYTRLPRRVWIPVGATSVKNSNPSGGATSASTGFVTTAEESIGNVAMPPSWRWSVDATLTVVDR